MICSSSADVLSETYKTRLRDIRRVEWSG